MVLSFKKIKVQDWSSGIPKIIRKCFKNVLQQSLYEVNQCLIIDTSTCLYIKQRYTNITLYSYRPFHYNCKVGMKKAYALPQKISNMTHNHCFVVCWYKAVGTCKYLHNSQLGLKSKINSFFNSIQWCKRSNG